MNYKFVLPATLALLTAACAGTQPYRCPMDGTGDPAACASMQDAYKGALSNGAFTGDHLSVVGTAGKPAEEASARVKYEQYQAMGWAQPADKGTPIYQEARKYRMWTAPWTDANGILHAGEYVYFTTPGGWNYGSLKDPGKGAGILGPIMPEQYGFNPVEQKRRATRQQQSNPALNNLTQGAAQNPGAAQTGAPERPTSTVGGITQPYERLTN